MKLSSKSILNSRIKFLFVFLLLLPVFLIVFMPYSGFNENVKFADTFIKVKNSRILPWGFYHKAEEEWPILKYNIDFQNKLKKAAAAQKEYKQENPSVIIFLKDGINSVEIDTLVQEIESKSGIVQVNYISKEEAYLRYAEQNKDNKELLRLVTPAVLPASIEIYTENWSADYLQSIKNSLQDKYIAEDVLILPLDPSSDAALFPQK